MDSPLTPNPTRHDGDEEQAPIRVLHFLWSGAVGGAQKAVYQLVKSQQAKGRFRPALAFARSEGPYFERVRQLGITVVELNLPGDRRCYRAWDIRRKIRPFAIHHFHSAEVTMMLASILCPGSVRIFTQRGGTMAYGRLKRLRHRITSFYLRHFFKGFSGNTEHGCRSGAELFGIPRQRWAVTYNGLDFAALEPDRPRREVASGIGLPLDGAVVIGSAAHLRAWKRIDWLLHAAALLPRTRIRILILGDGPDRRRLESLTDSLGLRDRTIFCGMRARIGDFLALMDIFVLPSTHLESFGNAVVEAMSQGLPSIVCRDSGGMVEHIRDGETGFIIDSIDSLAEGLKGLIDDAGQRQAMGREARDFIRRTYTFENMALSYQRLYHGAMENGQECGNAAKRLTKG